jgi:lysozyme
MEFSDRGIKLLAQLEGFKAEPYRDSGGKLTIGNGTLDPVDDNGNPTIKEVDTHGAMVLLLDKVQPLVATLNSWIKVPVNQNQFDALVCLGYNIGSWAITNSTLMR